MSATRLLAATLILPAVLAAGCVSEEATPIEDLTTTTGGGTPHLLEPSEQMRELAEQQCRDDPDLQQGEVEAVDPDSPDQTLARLVVDCDEVD